MEVIAAVSSIAGIVTLLSQCAGNTKALRDFFVDVSSASATVKHFLRDVESLLQSFQAVNDLILKLPPNIGSPHVLRLRIDLEEYDKDANRWVNTAKALQPASSSGAKAYFKKFSVVVNLKSVKDIQEELERYKNAISLNLTILGRELDVTSAAQMTQMDSKITKGTVATLSKIEDQAAMLEKIETFSRDGMRSSAASVRSLQSVETSLSRIEVFLSSHGSGPRSQSPDSGKDHTLTRRHKRRATGDFDRRARRSSAGSIISRPHSSASVERLPAVPLIPRVHLPAPHAEPVKRSIRLSKRQSSPEVVRNKRCDWINIDESTQQTDQGSITMPSRSPTPDLYTKAGGQSLQGQASISYDRTTSCVTQDLLAKRYDTDVLNYISLIRKIQAYESKISLLSLVLSPNIGPTVEEQTNQILKERHIHQCCLEFFHAKAMLCRERCILAGHSLHEIDSRFRTRSNSSYLAQHSADQFYDSALNSVSTCDVPCLAESVGASVYGEWSSSRDRINRWMLHCLQSDRAQGQLHRSMLADPLGDERDWASQLILHWYSDEAATGDEGYASPSSGTVDGREQWCRGFTDAAEEMIDSNDPHPDTAPRPSLSYLDKDILAKPDLNSFEISHLFLLEEELLTPRLRDWILINHRKSRSVPMRKLLKAWANFWVSVTQPANDPWEYIRALSSMQHLRDFTAGVLSLLEQSIGLEDSFLTIEGDQHLYRSRRKLTSSLEDFARSGRWSVPSLDQYPDFEVLKIMENLKATAFEIGASAIDFIEAWAKTPLGKSRLEDEGSHFKVRVY